MSIPVTSIVNVSVAASQAALQAYNPNSLAILSKEVPVQNYGRGATATATLTTQVISAVAVGAGGTGYQVPPPVFVTGGGGSGAVLQAVISGGVVISITIVNGGSGYTSTPTIVIGSGFNIYVDAADVGTDWGTSSETYNQAVAIFSQSPNITTGGGQLIIYAMNSGDTLSTAMVALLGQLYVGGVVWAGYAPINTEILAAATAIQAQVPPVMLGVSSYLLSDLYASGPGIFYSIQSASLKQSRGLLYTVSNAQAARIAMAAYMSRLQGTNFNGALTTATMNLKQLTGIAPDPNINTTILAQCQIVGADVYAIVGNNLPEVLSTGGNDYSDNVFNLEWLVGALQVGLFNGLATTPTKIPQTEQGMSILKNAIIQVLTQAVTNGFVAPGTWNGAIPFGDPTTFLQNITQQGWYILSQPISQQNQTARQSRQAPIIQIAVKYAGAIQTVQAVVYVQP